MRAWWWCLAGAALLSGCSGYGPPKDVVGMSRDDIVAVMGPPDLQRPVQDGTRLEFPRGPSGVHTWFVYLDNAGRVVRTEQVLTEKNFLQINPGMDQEAVRVALGRPSDVQGLARARGKVWSYRYENNSCLWFQVEISAEQTVRSAGYGEPPECRRPDSAYAP